MTEKKTEREIVYRRLKAKENYHKHKDEINARRRKLKKHSTIHKRKHSKNKTRRSKIHRRINSLKIGIGGRVTIHCPVHKNESLHRLIYNTAIKKRPTKKNRRGFTGGRGLTSWFYCEKCDLPRKMQLIIEK